MLFNQDTITLSHSSINDPSSAYTISIHKSQGSEFPVMIIPVLKQHFIMPQRNLIYIAITRGKNKVFIIGCMDDYNIAVKNNKIDSRLTDLTRILSSSFNQ
jgi:exodeoxyribonuclease V alpha subunit